MLISIIIPAYNAEKFIQRSITSILNQTYEGEIEIIVVDDGSEDGTAEIVKGFSAPVRYLYQENRGVSAARNHGIEQAKGDWIAFLDADDEYHSQALARLTNTVLENPDIEVVSGVTIQTQNGKSIRFPSKNTILHDNREQGFVNAFFVAHLKGLVTVCSVLIKKTILNEVGEFREDLIYGEDSELWSRIGGNYPWYYIDQEIGLYHIQDMSVTQNITKWNISPNFIWPEKKMQKMIASKHWPQYRLYRRARLLQCAHGCHIALEFKEAKKYLSRIHPAPISMRWIAAWVVTYLPGGSLAFRIARKFYRSFLKKRPE